MANYLVTGVSAQEVAATLLPKICDAQGGQRALAESPLHLIGHSRGGGMVLELARLLGERGVEVDQVTTLDPHPLTTADTQPLPLFGSPVIDTPLKVAENVLFTDNLWQNISYPKGEVVSGAYNRLWTSLPGGYHQAANSTLQSFADHLNIILAYHATVDEAQPVSNVEAQLTAE